MTTAKTTTEPTIWDDEAIENAREEAQAEWRLAEADAQREREAEERWRDAHGDLVCPDEDGLW